MSEPSSGEAISIVDRLVARWMETAWRWPKTAIAALAVLIVLSGLALPRFTVNADSSQMLSASLPAQQRAAELNDAFPELRKTVLVVVRAPTADAADLAVAGIVDELSAGSPWIHSVFASSADPFLVAHGFLYRDVGEVREMFSQLSQSSNLIAGLRSDQTVDGFIAALDQAAALATRAGVGPGALDPLFLEAAGVFEAFNEGGSRPFAWSALLGGGQAGAADGAVTRVITVAPVLDLGRVEAAEPALDAIGRAIAAAAPAIGPAVEIGVTGEPALRVEELENVFGTIVVSTAVSLVLVAILLRLALRASGRSVVAFISLLVSTLLAAGFAAGAIGTLNLVSVAFIVLMVGMGSDFALHVLTHIAETRRGGVPPHEAVVLTGQRTGLALGLSAVTTACAFMAFSVTDFTGMAQLGWIGGAGTIIAFLVSVTLIPAVVAVRPRTAGTVDLRREPLPGVRRLRGLPYVILLVGAAAIWPALHVRFDADPMALRDPDAPAVEAFRMLASSPRTTPYRANVLAPSLEAAEEIAARFEGIPGVAGATTIASLIPKDQDEKLMLLDIAAPSIEHAVSGMPVALSAAPQGPALERLTARLADGSPAARRLAAALTAYAAKRTPESDAAVARDIFRSFPLLISRLSAMLSADYVTVDTLPEALKSRYVSPEGVYRVEILPAADLDRPAEIEDFARTVQRIAPEAAGGPVQLAAAGEAIGEAVLKATAMAGVITALLAWFSTRRLADTVAILLPLAIAAAVTAAASVLLDMPFNYANVIVLPLMLGLGVDSGIHIAIRERRAPGAVFATSTPRAVLFSSLTTIAAFGTMAFSDHRGTASMGALLSISLVAACIAVLGLTPAIIRWMSRHH